MNSITGTFRSGSVRSGSVTRPAIPGQANQQDSSAQQPIRTHSTLYIEFDLYSFAAIGNMH